MTQKEMARRLANLYEMRSLRGYVRWKVRSDPAYPAVAEHLRGYDQPLLDLGCGVGLLPFFLRESGFTAPILGVDFDDRKIEVARQAARRYRGIDFVGGDARGPLPEQHNVVMLDLLHYLETAHQQEILGNVARAVPAGGVAIIRQAVRDGSWRYRLTETVDALARTMHWMRAEAINFPTPEEIAAPFGDFVITKTPLWGRLPFNNYLFVFKRLPSGGA